MYMKEYFKEQLDNVTSKDAKLFLAVYDEDTYNVEIKAVSRGWIEQTPYNAGYPFEFMNMLAFSGIPSFKKTKKAVYWRDATLEDISKLNEADDVAAKSLPLYMDEISFIPYKVYNGIRYDIEAIQDLCYNGLQIK